MHVFSIFNKKKTSLSVQIDHISPSPFLATLVALHLSVGESVGRNFQTSVATRLVVKHVLAPQDDFGMPKTIW